MARVFRALPAPRHYLSLTSGLLTEGVHTPLTKVNTIIANYHLLDVDRFREEAFKPEQPTLITTSDAAWINRASDSQMPALKKWFRVYPDPDEQVGNYKYRYILRERYLRQFHDCILPYELVLMPFTENLRNHPLVRFQNYISVCRDERRGWPMQNLGSFLPKSTEEMVDSRGQPYALDLGNGTDFTFHNFHASLELFCFAARRDKAIDRKDDWAPGEVDSCLINGLYIAQAQLSNLPDKLRADLPTPRLVQETGKGDIYDANLWMGTPPTYTPLHRDPNPNFFVQLASNKIVRLFRPEIGSLIFQSVREKLGKPASAVFRGEEMMMGPERAMLETAVWDCTPDIDGYEAMVRPGDALFIPKGWWHSVKSVNSDVNASVNWWFR